ncbi:tetra-peptide repeat homeobox protein 1-like [Macrobrachium rosenbergii]|uniref:tetra-peptide repeat homeobox protein 1-like n=1 Tax=Macrobrachium rosenbergii TaxID=79674 RepID=UPI0034D55903
MSLGIRKPSKMRTSNSTMSLKGHGTIRTSPEGMGQGGVTVPGRKRGRKKSPGEMRRGRKWTKCPNNNISSKPALALAVTDPTSLGHPAQGPIYVALPRGRCLASQAKAFDDSGTQMSLIREDKVPRGAIINRRSSKTQMPDFIPLPLPPECNVQWPPQPRLIPDPIPVPDPAPVPLPGPQIDPPPGDPILDSQSLPVSLGCTEQCQALCVQTDEQIPKLLLVPDPTLVPVTEHAPDLHSRGPSLGPISLPGLAPLPMPTNSGKDSARVSIGWVNSRKATDVVELVGEPLHQPSKTQTQVVLVTPPEPVSTRFPQPRQNHHSKEVRGRKYHGCG